MGKLPEQQVMELRLAGGWRWLSRAGDWREFTEKHCQRRLGVCDWSSVPLTCSELVQPETGLMVLLCQLDALHLTRLTQIGQDSVQVSTESATLRAEHRTAQRASQILVRRGESTSTRHFESDLALSELRVPLKRSEELIARLACYRRDDAEACGHLQVPAGSTDPRIGPGAPPGASDDIGHAQPRATPPAIPSLLLLGSVVGKLEDIMYGVVAPTDESLKIKSSCIRDGVVDSKVLEELVCPTVDDPFHHVSIQWRLYEDRDCVTLDTTGIMQTSWGERVGYNVSHSVGFPQLPAFTELGIARGNMSVCSLYRQKANNTVECYTRGFFDLSSGTHSHAILALQTIATQWLSFSRNMECAQMKKLAWRLRKSSGDSDIIQLAATRPKQKPADSACRPPSSVQLGSVSMAWKRALRLSLADAKVSHKRISLLQGCEMKRTSSALALVDLLPELTVSDADQDMLRELAGTLVTHNLEQSNMLLVTKNGYLNAAATQWKEMRRKDGLRIYRERPSSTRGSTSFTPSLLLLGTVDGTVEDVMYGVVAPTDAALKIKSTCVNDGMLDTKMLCELVEPSVEDPLCHVGIKWKLYNGRDYVSLDATGVLHSSTGERIGYNLSHSVAFLELPDFKKHGVLRGNMSVCSIYKQKTPTTVECYVRGFFEFPTKIEMLSNVALQALASQWLSFGRKVE
ncbi:unnamed protein product [Phytophthora lilii]|uniref:Unnamed protein product n=1 Tax=Phytophthora lilii TaxID=2077276 RepID=A0A9W6TY73_9STRA|nr:unnamed protein product [Phytophthora lilii]